MVAVAACLVIAMVLVPWAAARSAAASRSRPVAARNGLQHSAVDPFGCTRVAFPLFRKGDGRAAEDVVWRERADGLAIRAFDFSYYVETKDDFEQRAPHATPTSPA